MINLLIGGGVGSGKSSTLHTIIAAAAIDKDRPPLVLIDGKGGVELGLWEAVAHGGVRRTPAEAVTALTWVKGQMDSRYDSMRALGVRKLGRMHDIPPLLVGIDELATFTMGRDRKRRDTFIGLLHDVASRGRAAAIRIVATTQKPGTDVVPSHVRDLFDTRWAFRVSTRDASDTILGAGMSAAGYSAAKLPAYPGAGLLLAGGEPPVRTLSHYLGTKDLERLAAYAAALRNRQIGGS
ncbi:FtsK/SpoIIIE domain-containing protein [Streptosporangium jomthongense]|uniref:FtsK/SpoIIIE domain-containing protein n=1 Tax=Streptosporangium jomthongense TaxID=1193683 RepID=A0ABV8F9N1_9ACTN